MKRKAPTAAVEAVKVTKSKTVDSPGAVRELSTTAPKRSRKEVKSAKLAKRKPNYSLVQDAVAKWEVARRRDVSASERAELVSQLLQQVQGRMAEISASHTGSRIIQACIKLGSQEQRRVLQKELAPAFVELAKSPYGHFVASKLVGTATKVELAGLLRLVQGRTPQLLRHPCASAVVDELYNRASGAQRNMLAAEFFGREFALFTQDKAPESLAAALRGADALKQRAIVQRLAIHLLPIMEKGLLDAVLSHRLLAQYLQAAPSSAVAEAVETLAGPGLLRMVHTRHGAFVACCVLAFGTPKDRKKAVKAMKGHVRTMMEDEWAHVALLSALTHVDDTALLAKTLVPDILAHLDEVVVHRYARRVLLHLLAPDSPRYLPPHLHAFLHPTQPPPAEAAGAAPDALGVSKKSQDARRMEVLESGPASLAHALVRACAQHAGAWLRSPTACDVVVEAARGGAEGALCRADAEGVPALHASIVADLVAPADAPADAPPADETGKPGAARAGESALDNFYASRALRRLVLFGNEDGSGGEAARSFTGRLWGDVLKGRCAALLTTHGVKVLAAVSQCGDARARQEAAAELSEVVEGPLDAWAAALLGQEHFGARRK